MITGYNVDNDTWNWKFIKTTGSLSETGGSDKVDVFYIPPILCKVPYDFNDNFDGDVINLIKI
jgi:hypothetical protein